MGLYRPGLIHRIAGTSRQRKALLSGGLVLGLGAAATLAGWTDSTRATGTFSAGSFGIELNVGSGWTDGDGVNEMTFNATAMYPGAVVYAPVLVRTSSHSDLGAELTLSGSGGPGAFLGALRYRAVADTILADSTITCDANRFDAIATYVLGLPDAAVQMSATLSADLKQRVSAAGSDYAAYCFEVALPVTAPSEVQGAVANHTWNWDAVSISAEEVP